MWRAISPFGPHMRSLCSQGTGLEIFLSLDMQFPLSYANKDNKKLLNNGPPTVGIIPYPELGHTILQISLEQKGKK